MAESDALIPWPHNREIVLRQKDSVVVYDPDSKQLARTTEGECPYCHRPYRDPNESEPSEAPDAAGGASTSTAVSAPFASPEYFRMLNDSQPGSQSNTRPSTPRRLRPRPRALKAEADTSPSGSPSYSPRASRAQSTDRTNQSSTGGSQDQSHPGISSAAFIPGYFSRFFVEERELGRGANGVVLLVRHMLDGVSLGYFACKRIPVGNNHKWLERVLREVQLLQHLSHQNLVSYRHVWLESVKLSAFGPEEVPCAFVLQQFCSKGDLHSYILDGIKKGPEEMREEMKERARRQSRVNRGDLPEDFLNGSPSSNSGPRKLPFDQIRSFFKDIASGLSHLHAHKFIHRDLKPQNCLLHETGKEIRVLVSDFGEVQIEHAARSNTGHTGTISYCAPEVLRIDSSTGKLGNFTPKSDIFSLGMILHFMCFGHLPYREANALDEEKEDVDRLREEILAWAGVKDDSTSARTDLTEILYFFLRRLLALDPRDRPTAEEALHSIKTGEGLGSPPSSSRDERRRSSGFFGTFRRRSQLSPMDAEGHDGPAFNASGSIPGSPRRPSASRASSQQSYSRERDRYPGLQSSNTHVNRSPAPSRRSSRFDMTDDESQEGLFFRKENDDENDFAVIEDIGDSESEDPGSSTPERRRLGSRESDSPEQGFDTQPHGLGLSSSSSLVLRSKHGQVMQRQRPAYHHRPHASPSRHHQHHTGSRSPPALPAPPIASTQSTPMMRQLSYPRYNTTSHNHSMSDIPSSMSKSSPRLMLALSPHRLLTKTVLLVAKLLTLYIPCTPLAADPAVAGPLLALAMADLVLEDWRATGTTPAHDRATSRGGVADDPFGPPSSSSFAADKPTTAQHRQPTPDPFFDNPPQNASRPSSRAGPPIMRIESPIRPSAPADAGFPATPPPPPSPSPRPQAPFSSSVAAPAGGGGGGPRARRRRGGLSLSLVLLLAHLATLGWVVGPDALAELLPGAAGVADPASASAAAAGKLKAGRGGAVGRMEGDGWARAWGWGRGLCLERGLAGGEVGWA